MARWDEIYKREGMVQTEPETFIVNSIPLLKKNKVKEVLDGWKKDKKLPKEIMTTILNSVLTKCNIQALILSEQINLPPPIPLPKLQVGQKKD